VIRFGINLIVLCEWLLSIVLLACLWWLLAATHAVLNSWGIVFGASLGIVAVLSLISGFWLSRLDKRGWYSSNALGALLLLFGSALLVWEQRVGFPQRYERAQGATELIAWICIVYSTFGLVLLNLPKARQRRTNPGVPKPKPIPSGGA
jgi:hypothetical protein